jgi:hypothetical protein
MTFVSFYRHETFQHMIISINIQLLVANAQESPVLFGFNSLFDEKRALYI